MIKNLLTKLGADPYIMFKELLSENNKSSMMRFLSWLCVMTGCYISVAGLYLNKDLIQLTALASSLVGLGLGAKAWQKKIEGAKDGSIITTK